MTSAAYTPPQGLRSLEAKLVANSNGARLEPEWGEVRIVMRELGEARAEIQRLNKVIAYGVTR